MNTIEKRNQIIAMLYQNMDKVDADETLKLIDELSTMTVKNNAVLPHVSGSALVDNLGNDVIVSNNMTPDQWNTGISHHITWLNNRTKEAITELKQHYR